MANIGKKGLDIPKARRAGGGTEASQEAQTQGLSPAQKFNLIMAVVIGFGVACLLAMLAMLASTWQFKSNSYSEYTKTIREYNDKRGANQEERIIQLEIQVASIEAR